MGIGQSEAMDVLRSVGDGLRVIVVVVVVVAGGVNVSVPHQSAQLDVRTMWWPADSALPLRL
jgi:hypothetical protein